MKISEFCTSYKSRLPPKPREKGAKVRLVVGGSGVGVDGA